MHGDGGGSILNETVWLVMDGRIGANAIYGIYATEKEAEAAIVENDPHDSFSCFVDECDTGRWICPPMDI